MDKPKPGSFAPYLEYAQRNKQSDQPAANAAGPITLLEVLSRQAQYTLAMVDLQTLSGMDAVRFRDSLKSLLADGYVSMEGATLEEVVKLTDKGAQASRLARPA